MERQLSDLGDGTARRGAVEIDLFQLCFLLGLFDRRHFAAEGRKDLARAAMPYVSVLLGGNLDVRALEKCARRLLSTTFVIRERVGQSAMWRLTPLGIAIVERTVPAYLGSQKYQGIAALRAKKLWGNRREAMSFRWRRALNDEGIAPLIPGAEELVERWHVRNRLSGKYTGGYNQSRRAVVAFFVRDFVFRYAALPSGKHKLVPELHGSDMEIELDVLDAES